MEASEEQVSGIGASEAADEDQEQEPEIATSVLESSSQSTCLLAALKPSQNLFPEGRGVWGLHLLRSPPALHSTTASPLPAP